LPKEVLKRRKGNNNNTKLIFCFSGTGIPGNALNLPNEEIISKARVPCCLSLF